MTSFGRAPATASNTTTSAATGRPSSGRDDRRVRARPAAARSPARARSLLHSREHRCKQPTRLLTIHLGDHGEVLTDEAIHALELLDDPQPAAPDQECCVILTHAVSGGDAPRTIRLRALVGNQVMLLVVDSGSTHSFISASFTQCISASTTPMALVDVRVAGERLVYDKFMSDVKWSLQGQTFTTDMRLLELGAYDGVLGMDWLEQFSLMTYHWLHKTLTFEHNGATVTLQGIGPNAVHAPEMIESEQFNKWQAGNEIWYMALNDRQPRQAEPPDKTPPSIQQVLSDYGDVFSEPKTLPPHKQYDHAITLVEGSQPSNARPYRYSPLQKDEIERQLHEMLESGVIEHSMSPFAALVLLVKKKYGSWCFCVDYRLLNDLTVKNRFPLPIIDELLDELAGTKYFSKLDLRAGYHQIRM